MTPADYLDKCQIGDVRAVLRKMILQDIADHPLQQEAA